MAALNQNWNPPTSVADSAPQHRKSPPDNNSFPTNRMRSLLLARYYDPHTAEFLSPDPLEYVDGMSLFRGYFVGGKIDPSGSNCVLSSTLLGPLTFELLPWKKGEVGITTNPSVYRGEVHDFAYCKCSKSYVFVYHCAITHCWLYFGGYDISEIQMETVVVEDSFPVTDHPYGFNYDKVSAGVGIFNIFSAEVSWGEILTEPDRSRALILCEEKCKEKAKKDPTFLPMPTDPRA